MEVVMNTAITRKEFSLAYEKGHRQTENFLISKGLNDDQAREKAQAAWARGWERRFQLKDKEKTLSWINTIALNLHRSSIRKVSREEPVGEIPSPPQVNLSSIDLENMLNRCRKSEHQILKLRYFLDYDFSDLAKHYDCSEIAARVRLFRARKSLRAKYCAYAA
jgi:DNA-directed RNA polymerase specialized sigma24 family protein